VKDNKHVVLIVEDEAGLLDSYGEILEGGDFEVMKSPDGYKGLDKMEANKGVIDIVLLDLMMPGMDGLDVLTKIREKPDKYGDMPVVVLTNLSSERIIKEAFERGANGYLMKTELEPGHIVSEVQEALGGVK
jgi:two-component system response regulator (stage 0 sporulation protein F)